MNDFIANPSLLDERVSDEDHFDLSEHISSLSQKIDQLDTSSMIGIVAEYGKGKSTLIKQVEKSRTDRKNTENWLEFEAWKTPGRKELWETFVIDLARQIDKKAFSSAIAELNGTKGEGKKLGINTAVDITKFLTAGIVNLDFAKNLNHFMNTSPARRVFEIQDILKKVISQFKGDRLVIVIEDVDRSGEDGIYFIETLRQFIRDIGPELDKKLIIILPIAETSFFNSEESYLKCLDVIQFLEYEEQKYENFLRKLLNPEMANDSSIKQLSDFFILLSREYLDTTMRKIKLILRRAQMNYHLLINEGYSPDWRVCVALQASKFFREFVLINKAREEKESFFTGFLKTRAVSKNSLFAVYLATISEKQGVGQIIRYRHGEEIAITNISNDWEFIKTPEQKDNLINIPYYPEHYHPKEDKAYLVDYYLRH